MQSDSRGDRSSAACGSATTQRHGTREGLGRVACRSLSALTIPLVIALVALLILSLVLFRGRSRVEPGDAAADIQYRSAKTSGQFRAGTDVALDHAEMNRRGAGVQDRRQLVVARVTEVGDMDT